VSSVNIQPPPQLSQRSRRILYAVVTEFIASGEPVGSRTLAKKYQLNLSAATIRNVLADLEEDGYLQQPHTSAGRVPTDRAFRLFVDTLMQIQPLSNDDREMIEQRFHALDPDVNILRSSGQILSELTGTVAVIVSPQPDSRCLSQLRFIATAPKQLLAVIVLTDGSVENRFIALTETISEAELNRIHNLLADVIENRTLGEIRALCARRLADERIQLDQFKHSAYNLGSQALGDKRRSEVLIEGQARLLENPEFSDISSLKTMIHALEDRKLLLELLKQTENATGTSVLVGHEIGDLAGGNLSVVTAPFTVQNRASGSIGVVGLMRMDYSKVLPVVSATAQAMSDAIKRSQAHFSGSKEPSGNDGDESAS
jgi:heat-inducible transcriptional repressor